MMPLQAREKSFGLRSLSDEPFVPGFIYYQTPSTKLVSRL